MRKTTGRRTLIVASVLLCCVTAGSHAQQNTGESAVGRTASMQAAPGDPYPAEEWEVWYVDTFDRDFPPRLEVGGRGLVQGLVELWARHMFENVLPDGRRGFSSFHLKWKQGRVVIDGDLGGARRLREWLFGEKETTYTSSVAEADPLLLKKVATAHARLLERQEKAERILAIALAAGDKADFSRRLDDLIRNERAE
jgi:hypothetical protein